MAPMQPYVPINGKSMRVSIIISGVICMVLLSACGKKGPLYLPDETKANTAKTPNTANTFTHDALRLHSLQETS